MFSRERTRPSPFSTPPAKTPISPVMLPESLVDEIVWTPLPRRAVVDNTATPKHSAQHTKKTAWAADPDETSEKVNRSPATEVTSGLRAREPRIRKKPGDSLAAFKPVVTRQANRTRDNLIKVEAKRRKLSPTLQDLKTVDDVRDYCRRYDKSTYVCRKMLTRLQHGTPWVQPESLHKISHRKRAPRSFVELPRPTTPPGFWNVDDIPDPKMYLGDPTQ